MEGLPSARIKCDIMADKIADKYDQYVKKNKQALVKKGWNLSSKIDSFQNKELRINIVTSLFKNSVDMRFSLLKENIFLTNKKINSLTETLLYNKDVLDEYYFKYHSAYNKSLLSGPNYAKNFMKQYFVGIDDRIYDFQSAFFGFATPYGHFDMLIANCKTEEQAIEYQSFLNNHYADRFYTRNGTLVYQECQIPYLILYGAPLEKDGYLYYELENDSWG